jgi:multidrug efflux pump subunit AcrA (membrane-fusion protein)
MKDIFKKVLFTGWRYVILIVLVVGVGGYVYLSQGKALGTTVTIVPGDFTEQVSVSGTVIAAQDVDLGFAANGRIAGTYVRVGQHVDAGTLLAQTENGDLVATVAQKKAILASLQAGTRPEQVAVAQANVTSAASALVNAIQNAYTTSDDAVHNRADAFFTNPRTNPKLSFAVANSALQMTVEHDRVIMEPTLLAWAQLVKKIDPTNAVDSALQAQGYLAQVVTLLADSNAVLNQAIPDQSVSVATLSGYNTSLATARANVNSATTALTNAFSALTDAQKSLELTKAGALPEDIAAATAEVENARANLAKTQVVAPFGGTVTHMDAKVGETVSPNTAEISMQSDGLFQIETYVPEVSIARVAKGNAATTTLDAYGSSVLFPSAVVLVDPAETVKDGVPTYKTTLTFLKYDARIRSGMTANVVIQTGLLHNAIVIPAGSIGTKAGALYVSVLEKGVVVNRTVTVGTSPALGQAHILSGITAGDTVLLTPVP